MLFNSASQLVRLCTRSGGMHSNSCLCGYHPPPTIFLTSGIDSYPHTLSKAFRIVIFCFMGFASNLSLGYPYPFHHVDGTSISPLSAQAGHQAQLSDWNAGKVNVLVYELRSHHNSVGEDATGWNYEKCGICCSTSLRQKRAA